MIQLTRGELRQIVRETVQETLTSLGIQHENPLEMQRDFQYLRDWRRTTHALRAKGLLTAVGLVVAGGLAALWLGVQALLAGGR